MLIAFDVTDRTAKTVGIVDAAPLYAPLPKLQRYVDVVLNIFLLFRAKAYQMRLQTRGRSTLLCIFSLRTLFCRGFT